MWKLEEVTNLVNYYKAQLEQKGRVFEKPIRVEIFSRKTYKTFGLAIINPRASYYIIRINQWIKYKEELINTILHELSHLDSEAILKHHGPKWQRVANLYGYWYNTNITRTSRTELTIKTPEVACKVFYNARAGKRFSKPEGCIHSFNNEKKMKDYLDMVSRRGLVVSYNILNEEELEYERNKRDNARR